MERAQDVGTPADAMAAPANHDATMGTLATSGNARMRAGGARARTMDTMLATTRIEPRRNHCDDEAGSDQVGAAGDAAAGVASYRRPSGARDVAPIS